MKKLIYFLVILLSTHYLLAENEYDQLTGCRLQVAGSKATELLSEDQIRQGAEATKNYNNQATGYRLQGAGVEIRELSSQDKIDGDLDCCLMMNPAVEGAEGSIEKMVIGEARTPRSIESNHLGVVDKHSVNSSVECATTNYQSSSSYVCSNDPELPSPTAAAVSTAYSLQPIASIRPVGRIVTTVVREENTAAISLPHTTTSVAISSNQHQPISSNTASSLEARATAQEMFLSPQAQLEQVIRNKNEMEERLVKENEKFNVLKKKSEALCGVARKRRFDSEGKVIDENEQLYNQHRIVVRLQMALLNLNNIIKEAKEKSVPIEGFFVGHITDELNQEETNPISSQGDQIAFNNTELTYEEKEDETVDEYFVRVANESTRSSFNCLQKASGAEKNDNQAIVILWKKAAEQYQLAANYSRKYIEDITESGKKNPYCDKVANFTRDSASLLESAATALEKACEAEKNGDLELATLCTELSEQSQLTAEYYQKGVKAYLQKNPTEGDRWAGYKLDIYSKGAGCTAWKAVDQLQEAIISLEKATEAEKNNNKHLAIFWNKAVEQYQVAALYYQKAAEGYLSWNEENNYLGKNPFYQAGDSAKESADKLEDVATSLEKAIAAEQNNNRALADLWYNIAEKKQVAAECYEKATEVCLAGKENETTQFSNDGCSANWDAYWLEIAAESFEKAAEAKKRGRQSISDLWQKIAEKNLIKAECHQQTTKAIKSRNSQEVERLKETSAVAKSSADQLKKAIEFIEEATKYEEQANRLEQRGSQTLPMLWRKIAEKDQAIAEFHQEAATAYIQGNKTEAKLCTQAADSVGSHVDRLKRGTQVLERAHKQAIKYTEKETEAKKSKSQPIWELWRKTVEQYQFLLEHYRKAAEAQMREDKEEMIRFDKADWSIGFSADQLEKAVECTEEAIEAEKSRNQPISDLWRKTAEQYQVAAEYKRKSAEVKVQGNEIEAERFYKAAEFAVRSASRLKTAVEAHERFCLAHQREQSISDLWRKTAEENQTTAEYWRKAAEVKLSGNAREVERFENAADSARYGADHLGNAAGFLEKAIEASNQGNQSLSDIWRKISEQKQVAASHYRKAAEGEALGTYIPSNQYSRLDEAAGYATYSARALEKAAKAFEKAAEAEKNRNQSVAALWKKSVEENQLVAEYHQKAYEAHISGNKEEVKHWEKSAQSAEQAAHKAAREAEEIGRV